MRGSSAKPCKKAVGQARRFLSVLLALAAGVLLMSSSAWAVQPPTLNLRQPGWWVGLGFLRYERPYIGVSHWDRFIPLFNISIGAFSVRGDTIEWRFWRQGASEFFLVARPDALHYNPAANEVLSGMTSKLPTAMGGVGWRWAMIHHVSLQATLLTDLLRRNDGEIASVDLKGHWRAGTWLVQPLLGISWESGNYVNYYFGVTQAESRINRPTYDGKGTLVEKAGVSIVKQFGRHFALLVGAFGEHFGAGIKNSPIVAHGDILNSVFGLYFRF